MTRTRPHWARDDMQPYTNHTCSHAQSLSATLSYAIYALHWARDDVRVAVVRCALGVPEQTQIEVRVYKKSSAGFVKRERTSRDY
jgi:hypothetical protein